jgi:hypothetical protein
MPPVVRFVVVAVAEAIVGATALATIAWTVAPGLLRDVAVIGIWAVVIGSGTLIAWRWLGRPTSGEAIGALTAVITSGRKLRARLAESPETDDQSAWRVRVGDWKQEARDVVGRYAADRLSAFNMDVLVADFPIPAVPRWKAELLFDLDLQIDRLAVLRVSL